MAELLLTDEEKEALNYLDWSNEALGKFVRYLFLQFRAFESEKDAIPGSAAMHYLISLCLKVNAAELTINMSGLTIGSKQEGDWELVLRKVGSIVDDTCDSLHFTEKKFDLN